MAVTVLGGRCVPGVVYRRCREEVYTRQGTTPRVGGTTPGRIGGTTLGRVVFPQVGELSFLRTPPAGGRAVFPEDSYTREEESCLS